MARPVRLVAAASETFAWLQGRAAPPAPGLALAPDFADPEDLQILEALASRVRDESCPGAWLMQVGSVAVGLISYKQSPASCRDVEIGYGVAPAWRGRGVARRAVSELIRMAREDSRLHGLEAQTLESNLASQRVLQRNGFKRVARRREPESEALEIWRLPLRRG